MQYRQTTLGDLRCVTAALDDSRPRRVAIFCHGFGAPGTDLVPLADELVLFDSRLDDFLFVFPEAPLELDPGYDARAWWPINFAQLEQMVAQGEFSELVESIPEGLSARRQQIAGVIDELRQRYEFEASQVFVGGFSQGAMLTTDVFLESPEPLGGLVIWSGTLINRQRWRDRAASRQPGAIIQSHGVLDPILPFSGATQLRDLLRGAGHQVEFVPFQGYHAIPGPALAAAAKLLAGGSSA